jgi:hypothetical protein
MSANNSSNKTTQDKTIRKKNEINSREKKNG